MMVRPVKIGIAQIYIAAALLGCVLATEAFAGDSPASGTITASEPDHQQVIANLAKALITPPVGPDVDGPGPMPFGHINRLTAITLFLQNKQFNDGHYGGLPPDAKRYPMSNPQEMEQLAQNIHLGATYHLMDSLFTDLAKHGVLGGPFLMRVGNISPGGAIENNPRAYADHLILMARTFPEFYDALLKSLHSLIAERGQDAPQAAVLAVAAMDKDMAEAMSVAKSKGSPAQSAGVNVYNYAMSDRPIKLDVVGLRIGDDYNSALGKLSQNGYVDDGHTWHSSCGLVFHGVHVAVCHIGNENETKDTNGVFYDVTTEAVGKPDSTGRGMVPTSGLTSVDAVISFTYPVSSENSLENVEKKYGRNSALENCVRSGTSGTCEADYVMDKGRCPLLKSAMVSIAKKDGAIHIHIEDACYNNAEEEALAATLLPNEQQKIQKQVPHF